MSDDKFTKSYTHTVSQTIFGECIPYVNLGKLTADAFSGSSATTVNIYIDLYQIVCKLFRSNLQITGRYELAPLVLNMCAHYRQFYKKYYEVSTNFYIIYTNGILNNKDAIMATYNDNHEKYFKLNSGIVNFIAENTDILNVICRYFNGIYFIQAPYETMGIIYENIELLKEKGNNNPNIILSTNKLLFQLPAFDSNTVIFYHKRNYMGSYDYIIDSSNVFKSYLLLELKNNIIYNRYQSYFDSINPKLLSVYLAITGYKHRNILSLLRKDAAIKELYDKINRGIIPNEYMADMSEVYNSIPKLHKVSYEEFNTRFKMFDLLYNWNVYKLNEAGNNEKNLIDIQDPDRIRMINNKYFSVNPIDVERL